MTMLSIERRRKRQEAILLSLDKMIFATREQLQAIHNLGMDRNAQKVLNQMKEFLHIKMHGGRHVYYLNSSGRDFIGSPKEFKWTTQVDHYLLRNDMYIYFQCPSDWRTEEKITFKYQQGLTYKESSIIPDATFTIKDTFHFLEVDRTQSMSENKKKIKQYQFLSPVIEQQFQRKPVIVFYTTTELRRKIIKDEGKGLNMIIYTKDDLR